MDKAKQVLLAFNEVTNEIESLRDYYDRSNKTLIAYRLEIENHYSYGKKIADILDELFAIKGAKERNERLVELNETILINNLKFGEICEVLPFEQDSQNTISFSINSNYVDIDRVNPKEAKTKYDYISKYTYILSESILSHIIVAFESFLSSIYRLLLMAEPQKYLEGQTIHLAALFSERINEMIHERLDTEVSSKMYDSLSAIKTIAEKENIDINKYNNIFISFSELYYQRNAYVHTKGKANKDYLSKVDKSIVKNISINDMLVCDDVYINNAICVFSEVVFIITFELLKKEKAPDSIIGLLANYYFEKLSMGDYPLAKFVYKELSVYTALPFSDRLTYRINCIIAAKQLNEVGFVKHELDQLDVSATESQFRIAKECLCEHFDKVFDMLNETYPNSFPAIAIKEWPIFLDFRNTEYYNTFVNAHKADFAIQTIDDAQSELDDILKKEDSTILV